MSTTNFVGRKDATQRLQDIFSGQTKAAGKLTVQSIEGPGGIGKTSLFNHALSCTDLSDRHYLTLRIDGNDASGTSLPRLLSRLSNSASADAIKGKQAGHFFPALNKVIKAIDGLRSEAALEYLEIDDANKEGEQALMKVIDQALGAGKKINDWFPSSKNRLNFHELEKHRDTVEEAIPHLRALQKESTRIWDKIGMGGPGVLRNAIRDNALRPLANALVSDLANIVQRYRIPDRVKAVNVNRIGIERVLVIIDDFESLQAPLGEFLVGSFLPLLQTAPFESLVIILGRDQLEATHPAWDQHLRPCLQRRITVGTLPRQDMDKLVDAYGITAAAEKDRAWRDTEGYPFYVQLWVEETESGGRSAVMLKRFHDRTTRWMAPHQKVWLEQILFLDVVNKNHLARQLDDPTETDSVFAWFQSEGSVRDTMGADFRLREYLRSRLLDFLRITDPDRYAVLRNRSLQAGLMVA